jgi:hypothetical protein
MYHKVEGTGVYARIPLPNGGSLVEAAAGDVNITSAALRGGATLDENTSKGGTFGTVSIARHTHVSTAPAMNEGNIKEVLISPDVDPKTKQLVACYLITRTDVEPPAASVSSVNSASATGDKDNIPKVEPTKTGMDNIVDKAAEAAPKIIPPVVESVSDAATNVAQSAENSITSVSEASTKWTRRFKNYFRFNNKPDY